MDYAKARANMVDCQVRTNKVTDAALIDALRTVPREEFVPKAIRGVSYVDEDLRIADDRYLIEPMVLARLIQFLAIGADDVVLDVGSATGYSAAIVARLACAVVALESDPALAAAAGKTLQALEINNVVVVEGPLKDGYAKQAPYNAVLFQGAVDEVPNAIVKQLADRGRIAYVERRASGLGRAVLMTKRDGIIGRRILFDASVPVLPGFAAETGFVF